MVSAFLNTVKIPELRRRVLFTLAVIVIVRLGAAITTPGVNQAVLQEWFRTASDKTGGGVAALFNLFSGGALENCAIFSLGIMPYISASIMMQLLTAVIPHLGRMAREDGGRQKLMALSRGCPLRWRKRGRPLCPQRKREPVKSTQGFWCSWWRSCLLSSQR